MWRRHHAAVIDARVPGAAVIAGIRPADSALSAGSRVERTSESSDVGGQQEAVTTTAEERS
jgi:hypothetical protein